MKRHDDHRAASCARLILAVLLPALPSYACELCAVYNAANARGSSQGFFAGVSEQFTSFSQERLENRELRRARPDRLDRSMIHLVAGYDFNSRFGLSLNAPMAYRDYERFDVRYSRDRPPVFVREQGTSFGPGDATLISRLGLVEIMDRQRSLHVNLLAGLKFPTGDARRIREEMDQTAIYDRLLPPNTPHDPLGHSISSLHPHELAEGSGSWDGVFGVTVTSRWQRWTFNAQFQYALRGKGEAGFTFGDDLMISGGPGFTLLSKQSGTVSLQALASYETNARAELAGRKSDRTGMTAVYAGPQLIATLGSHWSFNAGIDLPLWITANGFQVVPEYRLHGGVSFRW